MKTKDNQMTRSAETFVVRLPRVQLRNQSRALKKKAHIMVSQLEIWDLYHYENEHRLVPNWQSGLSVACHNTYVESLDDGASLVWADPDTPTCHYCLKVLERYVGAEHVEVPAC
jgi:hypothetical protein